jgi:DNA repair protein RecO (recombination protein O)
MLHTTEGIVLHNVRYADKKIISKIYTRDFGLLTLNVNIGSTPKSKIRIAVMQPLSQLELVLSLKENKDVQQLIEAKCTYVYHRLPVDFSKSSIAQFINEVLYKCLKDQTRNEDLFHLIVKTYQWLDVNEGHYYDLHVYFLFELTKHLGFYPSNNISLHEKYFDTREGKFHSMSQSFPLGFDEAQSGLFSQLFNHTLDDQRQFNKQERQMLLDCLMAYYRMQVPGLPEFRSHQVLRETLYY